MPEERPRTRHTVRPATSFDRGLQHERTALAWERTAISIVVAGMVLLRYAVVESMWFIVFVGLVQTVIGAALLVWTGFHYEQLHGALRRGDDVIHPSAARLVGLSTVACTGAALLLAILVVARS